jgi:hypothetical protein
MKTVYTIRASSFGSLFDCAMRWEGEHLLKIHRPGSLRAWLGTSIHASTAAFDQAKLDGAPISADDAADTFVRTLYEPKEDVDMRDPKLSLREAERIGLTLHARYCAEIAPKMQYQSVEMALTPLHIAADGVEIRMTGTMDRARVAISAIGDKIISDVKTGGRLISEGVVSTKGRAAQLGTYQLLSEHTDGEPTGGAQIIALQTTSTMQVGVSRVFDAKRQLVGDDNMPGLIEMAAKMFKIGLFPPNPQSVLCDKKYCSRWGTCRYHD